MIVKYYLNGKQGDPERRNGTIYRSNVDTIAVIYRPDEFDQAIRHKDVALCVSGHFHIEGVENQLEDVILICPDGRYAVFTATPVGAAVARPFLDYCKTSASYVNKGWFELDAHLMSTFNDRYSFEQLVKRYMNIAGTNWENALKAHRQSVLYLEKTA